MEKIVDKFRSGKCTCDECGEFPKVLYQSRLKNGEPSEDSYCSDCFDHIQILEKDLKDHHWDCKCLLCR